MEQKEGYVSLFENKINEKGIEGLRFAIDGKLQIDKTMLGIYLEAHGAALCDTVTKKTNYLVLTDKTSTSKKRLTAEAYDALMEITNESSLSVKMVASEIILQSRDMITYDRAEEESNDK